MTQTVGFIGSGAGCAASSPLRPPFRYEGSGHRQTFPGTKHGHSSYVLRDLRHSGVTRLTLPVVIRKLGLSGKAGKSPEEKTPDKPSFEAP